MQNSLSFVRINCWQWAVSLYPTDSVSIAIIFSLVQPKQETDGGNFTEKTAL